MFYPVPTKEEIMHLEEVVEAFIMTKKPFQT